VKYYSQCPNCKKQHHASFPYCEYCGATWRFNLSDVVTVNKELLIISKRKEKAESGLPKGRGFNPIYRQ
jgi:uncharacterized OB-fold protein